MSSVLTRKFRPHKLADDSYYPMFQDLINDIEIHNYRIYNKEFNEFYHPYFQPIKSKKLCTKEEAANAKISKKEAVSAQKKFLIIK